MLATVDAKLEAASKARPDLYHANLLSPADIAERVHRDGIVVFPALLSETELAALNLEFDRIMAKPQGFGHAVDDFAATLNVRTTLPHLRALNCEALVELFSRPIIEETTRAYFRTSAIEASREVFVNWNQYTDTPVDRPPFKLHFDRREVFKFFYYFGDTGIADGAMRASPGVVAANRAERRRQLEAGVRISQIANVVDEKAAPPVAIDGPAGTLFVFTTDVSHGAGFVQPGHQRRIARAHCYSDALLEEIAAHS